MAYAVIEADIVPRVDSPYGSGDRDRTESVSIRGRAQMLLLKSTTRARNNAVLVHD
jgi:hypothetical protein